MKRLILGISLLCIGMTAYAKTLYVDATLGNDSITYEQNSESTPWRSIGRAAWGSTSRSNLNQTQAARAGDTVIVRAGTYSTAGTGGRFDPAYNPANSGTSSAPIIFEANGVVRLNLSSGAGPVIGAYSRDYIVWRGFYINEATAPSVSDTGSVVMVYTRGSRIENCEINGNGTAGGRLDNHNGIRLEYATDVVVRNNKIYNVLYGNGSLHHNGAGLMSYFSERALVENNEIYSCGSGIFVKGGDNRDFTLRYNLTRNNGKGIVFMYTNASGQHNVYQNVSINNENGISVDIGSKNLNIVNNTFVGNQNGVRFGTAADTMLNIVVRNNIVDTATEAVSGGDASTVAPFSLDNNLYYNNTSGWSIAGVRYTSISSWRSALGGTSNGDDSRSVTNSPLFQNASSADYRLSTNSPARGAGIDILDLNRNGSTSDSVTLGAYITGNEQIGYVANAASLSPPSPPTNVEIVR